MRQARKLSYPTDRNTHIHTDGQTDRKVASLSSGQRSNSKLDIQLQVGVPGRGECWVRRDGRHADPQRSTQLANGFQR